MKNLLKKNKKYIIIAHIFATTLSILTIIDAYIFGSLVDSIVIMDLKNSINKILLTAIIIIFLTLIAYISRYFLNCYLKNTLYDIKNALFSSYINKEYLDFYKKSNGEYFSNITNFTNELANEYITPKYMMKNFILRAIIALIGIVVLDYRMAIITMILVSLEFLIPFSRKNKIKTVTDTYLNKFTEFSNKTENLLNFYEIINSNYITNKFSNAFSKSNKDYENVKFNKNNTISSSNNLIILAHRLVILLPWVLGAILVYNNELTFGTLMAISQLNNVVTEPLKESYELYNVVQSGKKIEEKLNNDIISFCGMNTINFNEELIKITINDLSFTYGENKILDHINYTFENKKKYLLVGSSGSGKSTLVKIIASIIKNTEGSVLYNDEYLSNISNASKNKLIAYVCQNNFLLNDTLYNNLCLYEDIDESLVKETLIKVGLSDFTYKLDEQLGSGGLKLSGGELNRLSLARAIIKNPKVLILDEYSAGLDKKTYLETEEIITKLDCIVISISHKLDDEIVSKYDEIITIKNGNIKINNIV